MSDQSETIVGNISSIIFQKKDTGFHILKVELDGNKKTVDVKGSFPEILLSKGLKVRFNGKYVDHQTYGKQLHATSCEVIPEKGKNGIVSYLISSVPSIGIITANRLYDIFGDDLPNVLDSDPGKIKALDFLKKTQIDSILKEWSESSEKRTAAIFLGDLGLGPSQIRSVFNKFGVNTNLAIRSNPYLLADCSGIGFYTADQAARKLGIGVDDPRRIKAIIMFALNELSTSEGHVFATSDQIKNSVSKLFKKHNLELFSNGNTISDPVYYPNLLDLEKDGRIVLHNTSIYQSHSWEQENQSSYSLAKILSKPTRNLGDLEVCLKEFESLNDLELSDEQKQAFYLLKNSKVCVVSGYPGTGKTLLMSLFVYLFKKNKLDFTLMSPTGIAAKRLSQLTKEPAYTVHRALGCGRDGVWEFNKYNKYRVDAVIVDEVSMLDSSTFYHLVSALPDNVILIMVGDSAQLPSVGPGAVLKSLFSCSDVPHINLTRIYRQEGESGIIRAAHQILNGGPVDIAFHAKNDFLFFKFNPSDVVCELRKITSELKEKDANFQVIAPMYDGDLGVNNLNTELRKVLNSNFINGTAAKLNHGESDLYEGDRVMIIKNDYDRMVFNGDVGKVQKISIKKGIIEIKIFNWFDSESNPPKYIDRIFNFSIDEARQVLRVAYACTAHRYQGLEGDYILLPMTMSYGPMLYRNLVYTAITRAKKKVFLFGDPRALDVSVSNNKETIRNTNLSQFVSDKLRELKTEDVVDG
jgi:exodeoxyribonuclease V alpha subunit